MAEYDHNGNCVSDYIYAGNKLIAEYRPQTSEYFFYMNDQINTTRLITDENGNEVYSATHGPYGEIQKVWTNTFDPKLKFSGKEREGHSELDYFGARYYDHNRYRFSSVDPVINKEEALSNPQLWNLYAYCGNNPITFRDPFGKVRKKGMTPPKKWPNPPKNIAGKKPKWNKAGYWEGKNGKRLTWDDRAHGAGVDRGQGPQDGHWDSETSDERWDREGNPLGEDKKMEMVDRQRRYQRYLNAKKEYQTTEIINRIFGTGKQALHRTDDVPIFVVPSTVTISAPAVQAMAVWLASPLSVPIPVL
jgi:RHS repeat-associated protein